MCISDSHQQTVRSRFKRGETGITLRREMADRTNFSLVNLLLERNTDTNTVRPQTTLFWIERRISDVLDGWGNSHLPGQLITPV